MKRFHFIYFSSPAKGRLGDTKKKNFILLFPLSFYERGSASFFFCCCLFPLVPSTGQNHAREREREEGARESESSGSAAAREERGGGEEELYDTYETGYERAKGHKKGAWNETKATMRAFWNGFGTEFHLLFLYA